MNEIEESLNRLNSEDVQTFETFLDKKTVSKSSSSSSREEVQTTKMVEFSGLIWKERTIFEKILIVFSICAIIVISALSITIGVEDYRKQIESEAERQVAATCETPDCVKTAGDIISSINTSVDPCTDFYQFSCGTWIDETILIHSPIDHFSGLTANLNEQLFKILNEEQNEKFPEHFLKAQTYYQSCMNYSYRQELSLKPLIEDIETMGGWPLLKLGGVLPKKSYDWLETLQKMITLSFDNSPLVSVAISADNKNNTLLKVATSQPGVGLSDKDWFANSAIVDLYQRAILSYATRICAEMADCDATEESMEADVINAVDIEIQIASMLISDDLIEDQKKSYNPMTIMELNKIAPQIDWLRLFKIYFPLENFTLKENILVLAPTVLANISRYLENITKTPEGNRNLVNYFFYRQVLSSGAFLDLPFQRIWDDMSSYIYGFISVPDLWSECVTQTSAIFDFSLASVYIKKNFSPDKKKAILDLVEMIRVELKLVIEATSWMDNTTKEKAVEKLNKIFVMAAYPDELLDDKVVNDWYKELKLESLYYNNFKKANDFLSKKHMLHLREPVDRTSWSEFASSILESNAYYVPNNNSIFIPLGVAFGWFFDSNSPNFVNYGRMGFLLGHELSHAFDDHGATMDLNGNWIKWWRTETVARFELEKKCLVDLFDNYSIETVEGKIKLNGTKTLGENIADDIGIREAYQAYKKASSNAPIKLPGIDLNQDQLFWVNYAMVWCEKTNDDNEANTITSDVHALNKFRVSSPLSNSDNFIKDFNCKPGTKMNLNQDKCHVWGA